MSKPFWSDSRNYLCLAWLFILGSLLIVNGWLTFSQAKRDASILLIALGLLMVFGSLYSIFILARRARSGE